MNTEKENGNRSRLIYKNTFIGRHTQREHIISRQPEIRKTDIGYVGDMDSDGTVYSVVVIPVKDFGVKGGLGYVSNGFLVTNGLTRETYLFSDQYTDLSYWMEKTFRQYRSAGYLPYTDGENSLYLYRRVKEFIKNDLCN